MKYIYTSDISLETTFCECIFNNLPDAKGLWLPKNIPTINKIFINNLNQYSFIDIAKKVLDVFIEDIPKKNLHAIIEKSFTFLPELIKLDKDKFILELFHGPTFAFKDFGAAFMGNLYEYLSDSNINVITATSGDTGGAVANAFYNKKKIKVFVLYPKNKVSKLQEKQMTTLGNNIFPIEVEGTFDDCQKLVKKTLNDKNINIKIVSANSINIARLLPQVLYYFYLYKKLLEFNIKKNIVVSVPSGNLGNLTSGIIAKKMGIPIDKFICSLNSNKTFYDYIKLKQYNPRKSIQTLSSAMDVGNPSNFIRLKYLYNDDSIEKDIKCFFFSDNDTINSIINTDKDYNYLVDPHTAIGLCGVESFKTNNNYTYVTLSTAHPAKFKKEIESKTQIIVEIPKKLLELMHKTTNKITIKNDYNIWINILHL